jgi:hypothetical protein
MRRLLSALVVLACGVSQAQEKMPEPGQAIPPSTPLSVEITGKVTTFELDRGSQSAQEFAEAIKKAIETGGPPPAAPTVALTVKITNTSKEKIRVWDKGDTVSIDLELKGKGALNLNPLLAFTTDFRLPTDVELAPGKSIEYPIKALISGFRGASKYSYWTDAGDYELVATFKTGVSPAPKGAMENDGFGMVLVASKPLALKVTLKK